MRLSLSPTPQIPPNQRLKKKELSVDDLTANYDIAYRDGINDQEMRRSTSWYDGFFGCLKPVWTLMGKTKPSVQATTEGKLHHHAIYYIISCFLERPTRRQLSANTQREAFFLPPHCLLFFQHHARFAAIFFKIIFFEQKNGKCHSNRFLTSNG